MEINPNQIESETLAFIRTNLSNKDYHLLTRDEIKNHAIRNYEKEDRKEAERIFGKTFNHLLDVGSIKRFDGKISLYHINGIKLPIGEKDTTIASVLVSFLFTFVVFIYNPFSMQLPTIHGSELAMFLTVFLFTNFWLRVLDEVARVYKELSGREKFKRFVDGYKWRGLLSIFAIIALGYTAQSNIGLLAGVGIATTLLFALATFMDEKMK